MDGHPSLPRVWWLRFFRRGREAGVVWRLPRRLVVLSLDFGGPVWWVPRLHGLNRHQRTEWWGIRAGWLVVGFAAGVSARV